MPAALSSLKLGLDRHLGSVRLNGTSGNGTNGHANGNGSSNGSPSASHKQLTTSYIVCFAKVVDDKHDGVHLAGVYFGGIASDHPGAEQVARDCVNTVRGGTVIPRIFAVSGRYQLLPTMREAILRFRRLEADMMSAEEIITRSVRKK